MTKVTFWQYQTIICKGAWKKFSQKYGIRDFIVSAVVGLIVGIMTESLLNALATLGVFFLIYFAIYLGHYVTEHVFVYNEQERRINAFWPQDLDVRVYESDVREMKDEEGNIVPIMTFEVVNADKRRKMMELEAEIQSVHHTSIDKADGAMTIPFFPEQKGMWDDNTTTITLRPEGKALLFIAYLDRRPKENPVRVHFGEGSFTNHLFDREAMYQFGIKFTGKMDGELEFRQSHVMRVFYANPAQNELYSSELVKAISIYEEIPKPLIKIIEVADQGYWYDYSSPFQRQQKQKQKEAREAEAKNAL